MKVNRAVIVILKKGDTFLITKRSESCRWAPGKWQIPGGAVEQGEPFDEAGIREINEEVGVNILPKDLQFVGLIDYRNGSSDDTDIAVFISEKWLNTPRNMEPDKCSELKWINRDEIPEEIISHAPFIIENLGDAPLYIKSENDKVAL